MIVSLTGKPFVFFFSSREELEMRYRKQGGKGGGGVSWESGLGLGSR